MANPDAADARPLTRRIVTEILFSVVFGGVAPYVVYVVVHPPLAEVPSLIIGGLFPAGLEVVSFVRHRRLDPVSTLNLAALGVSTVLAMTGGSARFLLMKESLATGAIGIGFLVSAFFSRPAHFYLSRQFLTGNLPERVARYDRAWAEIPYMHAVLRTTTIVWGLAFVLEVTLRTLLIFRFSTVRMLVIGPVVFWGMLLLVITWTVFYARRVRPRIVALLDLTAAERRH